LADDHAVVREGLKALLASEPGLDVVGEAADGPTALDQATKLDPDVVVMDVSMPGMNGAEVTAQLRRAKPECKVLALTVHEDRGYLRMLLEAGAVGYVLKRAASEELVRAVRAVAAGGTYLDPALAESIVGHFVGRAGTPANIGVELSDRETEVIRLIARGHSNKEIAAHLGLSVKTVETYKTRSLEKLGLRSRVDIVRYAVRQGWLTPA
jgi:DNA-binding NarL/FixJ family response regulator